MEMKHLPIVLLLVTGATANAAQVSVVFSGTIYDASYADCQSYDTGGSCISYFYSEPNSSNMFKGVDLGVGSSFSGSFSYQANGGAYTLSGDGTQAQYDGVVSDYQVDIDSTGLPDADVSHASNSVSVGNNRNGTTDTFHTAQSFSDAEWTVQTYFSLYDNTGSLNDSFDIPVEFGLGDFSSSIYYLQITRLSDGDHLILRGDYDTLSVQEVPLPASVWLLSTAIAGVFGVSRRSRSKNR